MIRPQALVLKAAVDRRGSGSETGIGPELVAFEKVERVLRKREVHRVDGKRQSAVVRRVGHLEEAPELYPSLAAIVHHDGVLRRQARIRSVVTRQGRGAGVVDVDLEGEGKGSGKKGILEKLVSS